ncbi:MAG: hypothetical protein M1833_002395 [Piccolia ochrophora]|nr:MAG: hypothetical protein M1833_002395 [Piccolia ochrophora]
MGQKQGTGDPSRRRSQSARQADDESTTNLPVAIYWSNGDQVQGGGDMADWITYTNVLKGVLDARKAVWNKKVRIRVYEVDDSGRLIDHQGSWFSPKSTGEYYKDGPLSSTQLAMNEDDNYRYDWEVRRDVLKGKIPFQDAKFMILDWFFDSTKDRINAWKWGEYFRFNDGTYHLGEREKDAKRTFHLEETTDSWITGADALQSGLWGRRRSSNPTAQAPSKRSSTGAKSPSKRRRTSGGAKDDRDPPADATLGTVGKQPAPIDPGAAPDRPARGTLAGTSPEVVDLSTPSPQGSRVPGQGPSQTLDRKGPSPANLPNPNAAAGPNDGASQPTGGKPRARPNLSPIDPGPNPYSVPGPTGPGKGKGKSKTAYRPTESNRGSSEVPPSPMQPPDQKFQRIRTWAGLDFGEDATEDAEGDEFLWHRALVHRSGRPVPQDGTDPGGDDDGDGTGAAADKARAARVAARKAKVAATRQASKGPAAVARNQTPIVIKEEDEEDDLYAAG